MKVHLLYPKVVPKLIYKLLNLYIYFFMNTIT